MDPLYLMHACTFNSRPEPCQGRMTPCACKHECEFHLNRERHFRLIRSDMYLLAMYLSPEMHDMCPLGAGGI